MRKTNVDIFMETGEAKCKKHGVHRDWYFNPVKQKRKNGKIQTYRAILCRICGRENTRKQNIKNPNLSDDYRFSFNGTLVRILAQARTRAKKRKISFELDIEWLKKEIEKQEYRCAYSGINFDFSRPKIKDKTRLFLPSIDQKKSGMGYTKDNSTVVCSVVNLMKNELSIESFLEICNKIVKNGYL